MRAGERVGTRATKHERRHVTDGTYAVLVALRYVHGGRGPDLTWPE